MKFNNSQSDDIDEGHHIANFTNRVYQSSVGGSTKFHHPHTVIKDGPLPKYKYINSVSSEHGSERSNLF